MVRRSQLDLVTHRDALASAFPLPNDLEAAYHLEGKRSFLKRLLGIRNPVENAYYSEADRSSTQHERSRKFLGSMINPIIGKPMRNAEEFYQTFGRLMRHAWLSLSVGLYTDDIQQVQFVNERLLLAQLNNVDVNWRPAVSHIARLGGKGTIVEIGTGRGNSAIRLATLLPKSRIVTITISEEQCEIVQRMVQAMGLTNVEVRLGDLFNAETTADLIGQADATGAIEVVLHFPEAKKLEGMRRMAELLRPGSPLCIVDSSIAKPLNNFSKQYYANQSIYFGLREQYFALFEHAGLTPAAYIDYTADMNQAFRETTTVLRKYRPQLRREFGRLMSWLWPEVPGNLYVRTLGNVRYVQAVGIKN